MFQKLSVERRIILQNFQTHHNFQLRKLYKKCNFEVLKHLDLYVVKFQNGKHKN